MALWTHSMPHRGYTVLMSAGGVSVRDGVGTYTSPNIRPPGKKPKTVRTLRKYADRVVDEYEAWAKKLKV